MFNSSHVRKITFLGVVFNFGLNVSYAIFWLYPFLKLHRKNHLRNPICLPMVLFLISFLSRRKLTYSFKPNSSKYSKVTSSLNSLRWFFTAANFSYVDSVQLFWLPHSFTNSSNTSQKLIRASSCCSSLAFFIRRLNAFFSCWVVGMVSCTSNSLNTFWISA